MEHEFREFEWEKDSRLRRLARQILTNCVSGLGDIMAEPYQSYAQPSLNGHASGENDPDDWQVPGWTDA